jgi:hypothetical protein
MYIKVFSLLHVFSVCLCVSLRWFGWCELCY